MFSDILIRLGIYSEYGGRDDESDATVLEAIFTTTEDSSGYRFDSKHEPTLPRICDLTFFKDDDLLEESGEYMMS